MVAIQGRDRSKGAKLYRETIRDMVLKQAALLVVVLIVLQQVLNLAGTTWKAGLIADIVTALVAAAITSVVLYRIGTGAIRQYTTAVHQLEVAEIDIVERLAKASEFRDDATGEHVQRMSNYCGLLARLVGYSEREVDVIILASQMHDIGKIGIPDSILLKPGKLTPEERRIMESHVEIGARVLKHGDTPLVQMAYDIVLTHHEKWDGTGYPNGLSGEEIPMIGRIAAMCDVFEALTCSRPYKRAWSFGEATKELLHQSGKHFDPALVDIFMDNIEKFKEMYDRNLPDTEPWHAVAFIDEAPALFEKNNEPVNAMLKKFEFKPEQPII